MSDLSRYSLEALETLARDAMLALGAPLDGAVSFARGLVVADARGVDSHGVARLPAYVRKIEQGLMDVTARPTVVAEALATALVDAHNGLGQVASEFSMGVAIAKARDAGIGFVSTFQSNHFGIAGYYAEMALEHGMIGVCGTNSGPIVAPTFGKTKMLGTNPIAVAAPIGAQESFLLDMATSAVSGGKLQVAIRAEHEVPIGWGIDAEGRDTADPAKILGGGALLPLGSASELSSHKGYGLAMVVEILAAVLGGGVFGPDVVALTQSQHLGQANVSHLFAAIDISRFIPVEHFRDRMDGWLQVLKASDKAPGQDRIYVPGEKEWDLQRRYGVDGVPLTTPVIDALRDVAERLGLVFPDPLPGHA